MQCMQRGEGAHQYLPLSLRRAESLSAISLLKPYSVPKSTATGFESGGARSSASALGRSDAPVLAACGSSVTSCLSGPLCHTSEVRACSPWQLWEGRVSVAWQMRGGLLLVTQKSAQ